MVVIDTTVWVDYFRGLSNPETEWLDIEMGRQRLALTDLSLCELLQGLSDEATARRVQKQMLEFFLCDTGGKELAIAAAANFRALRSRGRTIRKTIDVLIATFCLRNGHSLLHRDRDFEPFEEFLGLSVVHARSS